MQTKINEILAEMEVNTKPTIIEIGWWCKRAAELIKCNDKELSNELFIMAEICFNYTHITKKEVDEYKMEYPSLLKNYLFNTLAND